MCSQVSETADTAQTAPQAAPDEALLTVNNLRVQFKTDEGLVTAVDGVDFEVKWIPRDLNASAVCICKLVDFDGYGLNDFVLLGLIHLLGPYIIDRFACSYNGELPWLNSLFFQPGC